MEDAASAELAILVSGLLVDAVDAEVASSDLSLALDVVDPADVGVAVLDAEADIAVSFEPDEAVDSACDDFDALAGL